jgi:hypothetical protein
MASVGVWRGLPTAGERGIPFGLRLALANPRQKGAVQPWFTKSDDEPSAVLGYKILTAVTRKF